MSYREYQDKLHTITPSHRRTLQPDPGTRRWFAAVALGCFTAAALLLAMLLGAA